MEQQKSRAYDGGSAEALPGWSSFFRVGRTSPQHVHRSPFLSTFLTHPGEKELFLPGVLEVSGSGNVK